MSTNTPEILNQLATLQNSIWQSISLSVSEATNQAINFGNPLTTVSPPSELVPELSQPFLVAQFSFASQPENSQVFLITQDHFANLAQALIGVPVAVVDETVITETRPAIEAIVQGLCLAVGNLRNDTFAASGLTVRFQIFSFPPNLQSASEIIRTNVAITGEDLSCTLIWLTDPETSGVICGIEPAADIDEPAPSPFDSVDSHAYRPSHGESHHDPNAGLDILMDIPLEISVELGRVKMQVRDVVDLGAGSIVEIDKAAGEPVDVLVNGRLVARGEVVVIEDNFGVRITEILSPYERLQRLNDAA